MKQSDLTEIKGLIARFSKETPLMVNPAIYKALEKEGLVPDDRVRLIVKIPVEKLKEL